MIFVPLLLRGQQSPTMYFMGGIPQRTFINPAFQPECKFVAGMPGFGQLQIDAGFSGFAINDLMDFSGAYIELKMDEVIKKMPQVNQLYSSMYYQPVFLGFRFLKRHFFTFDMKPRYDVRFFFPKDLFGMVWEGNGHEDYLGKRISFDHSGLEVSLTNEFSLGYSVKITKGLVLGTRVRMIQGVLNIQTERFMAGITTDAENFGLTLDGDIRINASYPAFLLDTSFNLAKNSGGIPFLSSNAIDYMNDNKGFGCDFGFSYTIAKRFQISASVNDIGSILWRAHPINFQTKGTFSFEGIDVTGMIQGDTTALFDKDQFLDSLMEIFHLDTTFNGYTQRMIPILNFGFGWFITRNDNFGILAQNQIYHGVWYPRIRVSYNHRFGRVLSLSGSYGLERGNYKNVGVGMSLKTGLVQFYLLTDNLFSFLDPLSAQSVGLIIGMNWMIGKSPK